MVVAATAGVEVCVISITIFEALAFYIGFMGNSDDLGVGYSSSEIAQRLSYLHSRITTLQGEAASIFDISKGSKPLNLRNEVEILEDEQSHHTRRIQLNTDMEEIQVQVENLCNLFKTADMINVRIQVTILFTMVRILN